jgi:hypothetical protein
VEFAWTVAAMNGVFLLATVALTVRWGTDEHGRARTGTDG